MRTADFFSPRTLWPQSGSSTRQHSHHDTGSVRATVSGDGRRTLRSGDSWMASLLPSSGGAHTPSGTVSGGGQCSPGPGRADGSPVGTTGSRLSVGRPVFNAPVGARGYAWWYIDGLSDDGRNAITVIVFLGS